MLGDRDGCEAVGEILRFSPGSRVLVYSSHSEEVFAARALRAGASGYLMKTAGFEEFLRAIDEVRAGRTYLSPHFRVAQPMPGNNELDALTDREIQIFLRMGEGKTTNEIADQLHLSPKTVAAHRENIKAKLGITSSAELMRVAIAYIIGAGNSQAIQ
jgi:DNA-binding NarL/FixJ family response regulator